MDEAFLLDTFLPHILLTHPLPWKVEHDWASKVVAANGQEVFQCNEALPAVKAEEFIARVAAWDRKRTIESMAFLSEQQLLEMLAAGELAVVGGFEIDPTVGAQAILADIEGCLLGVGEMGYATLFGSCACNWSAHRHFEIGDEERNAAHDALEELHQVQMPACKANTITCQEQSF